MDTKRYLPTAVIRTGYAVHSFGGFLENCLTGKRNGAALCVRVSRITACITIAAKFLSDRFCVYVYTVILAQQIAKVNMISKCFLI